VSNRESASNRTNKFDIFLLTPKPLASAEISTWGDTMLIILIVLLLIFGFGGYRMGPGVGYYGGGGISLILLIVIVLLLLRAI